MKRRRRSREYNSTSLVVILSTLLLLFLVSVGAPTAQASQTGPAVDLFVNRTPFDGHGANQSSDVYEPQEMVVLSALAVYNQDPVCGVLVAFQINGPRTEYQNITFVGAGITNDVGLAQFSFRIPWPCEDAEQIVFGEWLAITTVNIAGQVVVDTLAFRVGWIIRIIDINTLNNQLKLQTVFSRQDAVVFNLTVENIARTAKTATIEIDVQDSDQHAIMHLRIETRVFDPGWTNVQATSEVPISAEIGLANVSAVCLTAPLEEGGRLYSPAVYTTFQIAGKDIAIVNIQVSSSSVYVGETVMIDVTVLNKGDQSETFSLSVHYNSSLVETRQIAELVPLAKQAFSFTWDTGSIDPGLYEISSLAPLENDADPSDNSYVDGTVEVIGGEPPEYIHDIAVIDVVPQTRLVDAGEIVDINVTVRNKGARIESFYVTVYYDGFIVEKKHVESLAAGRDLQLIFGWNTSGVFPTAYIITATADCVEGETSVADNVFTDGIVTISPYPPFLPPLDWLVIWILVAVAAMAGSILLLLIFALDRIRRRRKRSRSEFTIVAHPHI